MVRTLMRRGAMSIVNKLNCQLLALLMVIAAPAAAEPVSASRQQQLLHLLTQDCGSCHGMTLQGGLGPPLTPDALAGKPREAMVATVMHGRPGTAMPPWSGQLEPEEIRWLVNQMYKGLDDGR